MGIKTPIPFGNKYGKLEVLSEETHTYHPNGKMKRLVKVKCDCGETVIKAWQDVKGGQQKSCGICPKDQPVKDISGKVVYNLTITSNYKKENGKVYWECDCKCGNTVFIDGRRLRDDRVRNCGECGTPMGGFYKGDSYKNREGYTVTIVGIEGHKKVQVALEDGRTFEVDHSNLKTGSFTNPYHRSVAGVGYFGVGPYIAKVGTRHTLEYEDWNSMLKRCYKSEESKKSYADKSVIEEWHCFQDFAAWATKQPNFGRDKWDLEKDLLVKNNKVYGPETCVYLPREINSFIKRKSFNGLPLGVDIAYNYDGTPYYRTQAREDGKNINLGRFYNVEEAFMAYKVHKEALAKKLADKWKDEIPEVAYKSLYNYTVEITD